MKVSGYTRKNGTKVKSYTRRKQQMYKGYHVVGTTHDGVKVLRQKGKSRFKTKDIKSAIRKILKNKGN